MSTMFETVRVSSLQDRKPFKVSVDGEDVLLAKIDDDVFAADEDPRLYDIRLRPFFGQSKF